MPDPSPLDLTGQRAVVTDTSLSVTNVNINAAGGDDAVNVGAFTVNLPTLSIDGGSGNDNLSGNDGSDTLNGGLGADAFIPLEQPREDLVRALAGEMLGGIDIVLDYLWGASAEALLAAAATAARAEDVAGTWLRDTGASKVKFAPCGGALCGTVVWLKNAIDPATGAPPADKKNTDPALRARTIMGLQVVSGMKPSSSAA